MLLLSMLLLLQNRRGSELKRRAVLLLKFAKKEYFLMEKELSEHLKLKDFEIIKDDGRLLFKKNNDFIIKVTGNLSTTLLPKLLPLLNGKYSTQKILDSLKEIDNESILSTLGMLKKYEIVETDNCPSLELLSKKEIDTFKHQIKFFSYRQNEEKYEMQISLKKAKVNLVGTKNFLFPLVRNLINSGIGEITFFCKKGINKSLLNMDFEQLSSSHSHLVKKSYDTLCEEDILFNNPDFLIVADEDISIKELDSINGCNFKNKVPWISFSDIGEVETIIGPLVVPYKTPCYRCFELRKESNLNLYKELRLFKNADKKILNKKSYLSPFIEILSGIMALEVIKYLSGVVSAMTLGKIYTINWLTMETKVHHILKLPRCPVCGVKEKAPFSIWQEPIKE
ncbi:MAG: TOMM precursor leader peptide-binding protein [Candidatus Cloacimonadota bacterium]|nr:MAG: TOMM precursor leader peptide-binding protein [Candidatus Cloacimonadota bacterium]